MYPDTSAVTPPEAVNTPGAWEVGDILATLTTRVKVYDEWRARVKVGQISCRNLRAVDDLVNGEWRLQLIVCYLQILQLESRG